jgi:hypothetical protein
MKSCLACVGTMLAALLFVGCVDHVSLSPPTSPLVVATDTVALTVSATGSVLFGNRVTGDIFEFSRFEGRPPRVLATVDVNAEFHRGLIGLAASPQGEVYASWVDPFAVLTLGAVTDGTIRVLWTRSDVGMYEIGGSLHYSERYGLLLALGPLASPFGTGAIVAFDPRSEPPLSPRQIVTGFDNPYAFDEDTGTGDLFVADNTTRPGGPERLVRATPDGTSVVLATFTEQHAPVTLQATPKALVVCDYLDGRVRRFAKDGVSLPDAGATGCAYGARVVGDRLLYLARDGLREAAYA